MLDAPAIIKLLTSVSDVAKLKQDLRDLTGVVDSKRFYRTNCTAFSRMVVHTHGRTDQARAALPARGGHVRLLEMHRSIHRADHHC